VVTIQDLLGHSGISTTERYCTVSNIKVMWGYFKFTSFRFFDRFQLNHNLSIRINARSDQKVGIRIVRSDLGFPT